jgi:hypothetical protein
MTEQHHTRAEINELFKTLHLITEIEHKQGARLQALRLLVLSAAGDVDMGKIHDELLASARALDASVDTLGASADHLIAAKGATDSTLADVQSALASTGQKLADLQARMGAAVAETEEPPPPPPPAPAPQAGA